MNIEVLEYGMLTESIDPVIYIKCKMSFVSESSIISHIGARLYTVPAGEKPSKLVSMLSYQAKKGHSQRISCDRTNNNSSSEEFSLIGTISNRVADYLEINRNDDRRGDVRLHLKGEFSYVSLNLHKKHVQYYDTDKPQIQYLCTSTDANYYGNENILTYSDRLGELYTVEINQSIVIPASDWMHDYKPLLGLGSYIGIELPLASSSFGNGKSVFQQVFEKVEKIREHYLDCRWGDVILDFRKLMEYLRTEEAKEALEGSKRYNPETREDIGSFINTGFNFASKFHHVTDRSGSIADNPEYPTRAEAEFCLGFVTGLSALLSDLFRYEESENGNVQQG